MTTEQMQEILDQLFASCEFLVHKVNTSANKAQYERELMDAAGSSARLLAIISQKND